MKNIQYLLLDIDGILIEDDKIPLNLINIIKKIGKIIPVGIASARSIKEVKELGLLEIVNNNILILENGSIIYRNGKRINEWEEKLEDEFKEIKKIKENISEEIKIERERIFAIKGFLKRKVETNKKVRIIKNRTSTDFIPISAGKHNAFIYLFDQNIISKNICFIADGINDIELLSLVNFPLTVSDANKEVVKLVKERGTISKKASTKGTLEHLENILTQLQQ